MNDVLTGNSGSRKLVSAAVVGKTNERIDGGRRGTRKAGNSRTMARALLLADWSRMHGSAMFSYAGHQLHWSVQYICI